MDDVKIDSIISEAVAKSQPAVEQGAVADNVEPSKPENVVDETTSDENPENPEKPDNKNDQEEAPLSQKALNAIRNRNRRINQKNAQIHQQKAEIARLSAELQALKAQSSNPNRAAQAPEDPDAPRIENFKDYGEFMKASLKHELKKEAEAEKLAAKPPEPEENKVDQEWFSEREKVFATKVQDVAKNVSDFAEVLMNHADFADSLSPEVQKIMAESDNAPLTYYILAKEGTLLDMADMSLPQAVAAIARAEVKGEALLKKPVSNAPVPLSSNRGTAPGAKPLAKKSYSELKDWLNS